jgi:geranylgeranyl pyrophosphate synthase
LEEWADEVTLAWLLFYSAADLMDSVQDQDEPDEWWQEQGAGAALAAASGLYFTGSFVLDRLQRKAGNPQVASSVGAAFYQAFMVMTSGQYRDLTAPARTLEDYWRLAEAKSGAFFRLACLAGAQMASSDPSVLAAFADYGLHLGLLIQVMDDLDDIRRLHDLVPTRFIAKIKGSLPFIYAMELSPAHTQKRLLDCLDSADKNRSAVDALVALLDECQAALYVTAEMEKQRGLARASLEQTGALAPYQDALAAMVTDL